MRRPISSLHPRLYEVRVAELCLERRLSDRLRRLRFATTVSKTPLPVTIARHASLLRRPLRDLDPRLQESKIVNLALASNSIDGLLIRPGEVFSFWDRVGPPTAERGFVEGLVLRRGEIEVGIGGGLCQLSNLLHWLALHAPLRVVEQHHHGFDPFPDSRRVVPFGSGATIFYNYGDLRLRNDTDQVFQILVRVGPRDLEGAIATDRPWPYTYHVDEVGHRFSRGEDGAVYRSNELWQRVVDRRTGRTIERRLVLRNHALVRYPVPDTLVEVADTPSVAAPAC